ncbi:MAG TPA: hypothetical protein EYP14_13550, partial [Planctomycetaceae bacterium]|nr:hypothetical protein [Planctomycetaceae bacterium]
MHGHGRPAVIGLKRMFGRLLVLHWPLLVGLAVTAVQNGRDAWGQASPTAPQDDATLFAVDFVGTGTGWAVGDRGVVWRTIDGGRTWRRLPTPVECSLRDVCFLTDQVGWVVGGGFEPFTQSPFGVVLHTTDGGRTWKRLDREQLPLLVAVRFFGPQTGIVVGVGASEAGPSRTAVFVTTDGGKSWEPLAGEVTGSWRGAAFIGTGTGVVVGRRGRVGLVGGRQLLPPRLDDLGRRGLYDVQLQPDLTGWLVGDGGLILRTTNGGIVWESPDRPLPETVREVFDFRAVACRGKNAWVAGAPGSVVWHTSDNGRTWHPQMTGQPLPIYGLDFPTDRFGCAVGAMGVILRTDDGGTTWRTVRGGRRRAALLALYPETSAVSFEVLSRYGADQGYRCVIAVTTRNDLGPDGFRRRDADLQLHQAVVAAGGCEGRIDWPLSLDVVPDLRGAPQTLIAAWLRQTEGRLPDVLIGRLVGLLRMWRPTVVVIDRSDPKDASRDILQQAVLAAVLQAADATRWLEHFELAGLGPWQARRVFVRRPAAEATSVRLDPQEFLPRIGTTPALASATSYGMLGLTPPETRPEPYTLIWSPGASDAAPAAVRDFWSGLVLAPGSDARRTVPSVDAERQTRRSQIFRKHRHLTAISERLLDDPLQSSQLLAHLDAFTTGLPRSHAAVSLLRLGDRFVTRGRWDLAEETWLELARRFPDHPAAGPAMRWLFCYWSSAELAWQRNRKTVAQTARQQSDPKAIVEEVRQSIRRLAAGGSDELTERQ